MVSQKTTTFSAYRRAAQALLPLEVWVVAGVVAGSMLSSRLLPYTLGAAAVFWPLRWIATGRLSRRSPVDWAVALLVLMVPVTLWATALPDLTQPQVLRLLSGILLFYAILNWAHSASRLRLLAFGAILAGLGLAAMAPFSVEWSVSKLPFIPAELYQRFTLLVSDTVHPNVLAGNLALLFPLALALPLFAGRKLAWYHHMWILAAAVGMGTILFLTKSRGAWMGVAAVLLLLPALRWRWGWLLWLVGAAAAGFAVTRLGLPNLLDMLSTSGTVSGLEGRVEIWSRAIYMIQDFPFTGVGMGSFMRVADLLYPFFLAAPGTIEHAHNIFLQVAVDLGIPGLIAWLAILLMVVFSSWQVYRWGRRTNDWLLAALGASLLSSQLALVVHGITDAVVWGMVRPAPLVWALWALAFAAANLSLVPIQDQAAELVEAELPQAAPSSAPTSQRETQIMRNP